MGNFVIASCADLERQTVAYVLVYARINMNSTLIPGSHANKLIKTSKLNQVEYRNGKLKLSLHLVVHL